MVVKVPPCATPIVHHHENWEDLPSDIMPIPDLQDATYPIETLSMGIAADFLKSDDFQAQITSSLK